MAIKNIRISVGERFGYSGKHARNKSLPRLYISSVELLWSHINEELSGVEQSYKT